MAKKSTRRFTEKEIEKIKQQGFSLRAEKGWSLEMIGKKYGRTRQWASLTLGLGKVKRFSAVKL